MEPSSLIHDIITTVNGIIPMEQTAKYGNINAKQTSIALKTGQLETVEMETGNRKWKQSKLNANEC